MKRIQCRLRTQSAVSDWLAFMARIENVISAPQFRVNGKQRKGHGFYTSLRCDVEPDHMIDVLTEYIAFLEKKATISFEMIVEDTAKEADDASSLDGAPGRAQNSVR